MTPQSSELVFTRTPLSITVAVLFVVIIAIVSLMAWQRSGWRASIGWLELLRILIAAAIAITLHQPEWHETFQPETKPVVAVLHDVSGSMETRDVINENDPAAEAQSRTESIAPMLSKEIWQPLAERMDTVIEGFASTSDSPPTEGTDVNAALLNALEQHPRLTAVVIASDGDWNTGAAPSQAATRLRMRGIPVIAVPTGADTRLPDIAVVSFDVPTFAVAGKPLRIPFSVDSSLPREEVVSMIMTTSDGEEIMQEFTLPAMGRLQDAIFWRPGSPGKVTLTLKVPKTGGEKNLENNEMTAELDIRLEQLRVLVIETFPRWEYRYLRNALERDPGVEVNTLLFHPDLAKTGAGRGYLREFPTDEKLATYDVILLGDVGVDSGQLTADQCSSIVRMVRDQAAGLVFMPGLRGYMGSLLATELAQLMPIVWDQGQPRGWGTALPGKFTLTEAGTLSLLTKLEDTDEASARVWSQLPGFQWYGLRSEPRLDPKFLPFMPRNPINSAEFH